MLDDLKVGDEVAIVTRRRVITTKPVEEATATQIKVDGKMFDKEGGYSYRGMGHPFLSLDPTHILEGKEIVAKKEREYMEWLLTRPYGLTNKGVQKMRAVADQAEAYLREIGEWEKESN